MALKCFALVLALSPLASIVVLNTAHSIAIDAFKEAPFSLYVYITVLFIAGGILFYSLLRKLPAWSLSMVFLYLICIGYFYNACYMPIMDKTLKSPRLITDHLGDMKKDKEIFTTGFSSAGIIFYVGKPIQMFVNINEIKDKKNDILLIVEDDQAKHMQKDLDSLFLPVGKTRYEREFYTFYVRKDD